MKKLILILTAVLLIFPLAACVQPEEPQPPSGYPEFVLEPEREDLPSYEDLAKIEEDMNLAEIQNIIGNPQRIGEHTWQMPYRDPYTTIYRDVPFNCYIYDGSDGSKLYIGFQSVEGEVILKNYFMVSLIPAEGNGDTTT